MKIKQRFEIEYEAPTVTKWCEKSDPKAVLDEQNVWRAISMESSTKIYNINIREIKS